MIKPFLDFWFQYYSIATGILVGAGNASQSPARSSSYNLKPRYGISRQYPTFGRHFQSTPLLCLQRMAVLWWLFRLPIMYSEEFHWWMLHIAIWPPSWKKRRASSIQIISLTPPGRPRNQVLDAIITDIIVGMIDWCNFYDIDGENCRFSLISVDFLQPILPLRMY